MPDVVGVVYAAGAFGGSGCADGGAGIGQVVGQGEGVGAVVVCGRKDAAGDEKVVEACVSVVAGDTDEVSSAGVQRGDEHGLIAATIIIAGDFGAAAGIVNGERCVEVAGAEADEVVGGGGWREDVPDIVEVIVVAATAAVAAEGSDGAAAEGFFEEYLDGVCAEVVLGLMEAFGYGEGVIARQVLVACYPDEVLLVGGETEYELGLEAGEVVVTGDGLAGAGIVDGEGGVEVAVAEADGVVAGLRGCEGVPDVEAVVLSAAAERGSGCAVGGTVVRGGEGDGDGIAAEIVRRLREVRHDCEDVIACIAVVSGNADEICLLLCECNDELRLRAAVIVIAGELGAGAGVHDGEGGVKVASAKRDDVIAGGKRGEGMPDVICVIDVVGGLAAAGGEAGCANCGSFEGDGFDDFYGVLAEVIFRLDEAFGYKENILAGFIVISGHSNHVFAAGGEIDEEF